MTKGWIWKDPKYGTWFLPREAVVEDWKQDHFMFNEDVREPTDDEVEVWYNEQTTWIEVSAFGKQLEEPDMECWKKVYLEQMKSDYEYDYDAKEVE